MELSEQMMVERYELGNAQEDAALRSHGGLSLWLLTLVLTAILGVLLVAVGDALHGWDHLSRAWSAVRDGRGAHDRRRPEPTGLTGSGRALRRSGNGTGSSARIISKSGDCGLAIGV